MPNGPGTYGSKRGRPKKVKFDFDKPRKTRKDRFSKKPVRAPRGTKKKFGDNDFFKKK